MERAADRSSSLRSGPLPAAAPRPGRATAMWLILYLLALAALALRAPDVLWQPGAREFVVLLGLLGAWRYSWGAVHLGRALYYRGVVFPRWRRAADRLGAAGAASHVYILIATYRIRAEATARVYQAAIAEAIRYGRPATIVAGIVEIGDQRLIKRIFQQMKPPAEVRLAFVRRPGIGKRHQMACSLRAISRMRPPRGAAVVFMDGDTLLTPGCLAKSLPFLKLMPDVDAITTDEECIVANGPLMQAWHSLRFAQRHQMMSSMGLSRRLLVITGRMSIYRAEVATNPNFIEMLENDHLDHWRLGRLPLLTGEDKSTWYWLLQAGRRMLYLPDVSVVTLEYPLAEGPAPCHHQADAALVRQHAPGQLAGDCARAQADRPVRVVVPDRSAPVDVDPAVRSGGRGAVRALASRCCSSTPICSGSP